MSVRKRTWTTRNGESRQAWVVDYVAQDGQRHIKTFDNKKDADAWHASVNVAVAAGIHTPESRSITVAEAGALWLLHVEQEDRERTTLMQYRQHLNHIVRLGLGREKLARLTTPRVNAFRDALLDDVSRPLARKIMISLKGLIKDARRRGLIATNPADGVTIGIDKRATRRLKVGVDIPTPQEIAAIIAAVGQIADGRWRPLLVTAVFTGLRASELRGLRWSDVDLAKGELHVRQRADRLGQLGSPKSASSARTIPLGPMVVNALKTWKLACPRSPLGLAFPSRKGGILDHVNAIRCGWWKAQIAAGVTIDGKPKYSGLHALRHFYASWCINRKEDGGLGLPPKVVQDQLGHASIVMTFDRYGHLFPRQDDGSELAAAERALFALVPA